MVAHLTGTPWLRELRPGAAANTVLVCFPPGGGSVTAYRALASLIGPGTTVFAVQYPGRQERYADQPVSVLTDLAAAIAQDLLRWPATTRLALFGHSMGATLAYETARRLAAAGRTPAHLFVSGRPAPAYEESGRVHRGTDSDLIGVLERLANDPASVRILRDEPGLAELVLPAVRADYTAIETYRHEPGDRLNCPITTLVSTADPTVTVEQAGEWANYTTASFDLVTFPGAHFYLDLPEQTPAVAKTLTDRLNSAAG
ncbi:thioesterase II family protein [Nocardia sp. NPDC057668]|uniref:thioesterase II family protein n=1 Tax=Nocardia sp. NPDC057668 TaxID=3346202 RepID=UPI00366F559C